MNILYLCDEYPPCQHGGIGTVTQLLARTLVAHGHNVYVAGFYPYYRIAVKEEMDEGVKVFRFFYGSKLLLQFSKRRFLSKFINIERQFNNYIDFLRKIVKGNQIEIIETPDFVEAFRYSGERNIQFPDFGIPMIVKLHGTYSYFSYLEKIHSVNNSIFKKEKIHLDNAASIIALSNFVLTKVKTLFSYDKSMHVIYNGTNTNTSAVYMPNQTGNTVVFAGTLAERKGIFSLLQAWGKVLKVIPSASLFIYGKGSRKIINSIRKVITDLPINSVELKGFISKEGLPYIYSTAACAIFPSYAESFSLAPMEAMAVGCPVIYTSRTSGPELITHGVDGLLIDPDDIQGIADAIILMLTNRQRAIEFGQNGLKNVRANFDINLIAEKHMEHYKNILVFGIQTVIKVKFSLCLLLMFSTINILSILKKLSLFS